MSAKREPTAARPFGTAVDAYLAAGWSSPIPLGEPGERSRKSPRRRARSTGALHDPQVDGELVVELRRMRERYVDGYIQRKINHRNGDTDGEQLVTWDGEAAQRWDEAYPACAALIAASDTTSDEEPNE